MRARPLILRGHDILTLDIGLPVRVLADALEASLSRGAAPPEFEVEAVTPEDGTIDCSKVNVNTALGHNDHSHGDQSMTGCSGEFTIPAAWEDKTQHIWYIVSASYTDKTTGLELTGSSQVDPQSPRDTPLQGKTSQPVFRSGSSR